MKITFLGTGGGRFSAISQRRMTGGFRIDNLNGKNYHVDPGPGALVRTYQFGFDPRNDAQSGAGCAYSIVGLAFHA